MVIEITKEEESDLAKIAKASEKFNAQADEATRYIVEIEGRLNESRVGRVVWLDSPAIRITKKHPKYTVENVEDTRIGFAKIGGEWGIAVSNPERLLRKADRATRIAAVPLIPKLLKRIVEEAENAKWPADEESGMLVEVEVSHNKKTTAKKKKQ